MQKVKIHLIVALCALNSFMVLTLIHLPSCYCPMIPCHTVRGRRAATCSATFQPQHNKLLLLHTTDPGGEQTERVGERVDGRVISYHCFDLWPVFKLNMLCTQWQHPSLLQNTCLLTIKKYSIFSLFKESTLLQGRKRNYRTIITSKCKKGGEMWVVVGGRGVVGVVGGWVLVNGHSASYSCLWDSNLVPGRFPGSPQLISAHAGFLCVITYQKVHSFLWSSLQSIGQREKTSLTAC